MALLESSATANWFWLGILDGGTVCPLKHSRTNCEEPQGRRGSNFRQMVSGLTNRRLNVHSGPMSITRKL